MGRFRRFLLWFDGPRRIGVVALAGWIGIVVIASGTEPTQGHWLGLSGLRYVGWALLVVFGLLSLGVLVLLATTKRERRLPERRKRSRWWWVPLAIAVGLFMLTDPDLSRIFDRDGDSASAEEAQETNEAVEGTSSDERVEPLDGLMLLVGLGVAAAVILWTRGRLATEAEPVAEVDLRSDVAEALERATDDLLNETDPRAAVLNAYARLERTLGERGEVRQVSETAAEHLRRALRSLPIDDAPLRDLGALYELARFSARPISEADRESAAQALALARRGLAALAEV